MGAELKIAPEFPPTDSVITQAVTRWPAPPSGRRWSDSEREGMWPGRPTQRFARCHNRMLVTRPRCAISFHRAMIHPAVVVDRRSAISERAADQ